MNRTVPTAFALLGVILGAVTQLTSVAPALIPDPTPGPLSAVVFLFAGVSFLLSTVTVAGVGYLTSRRVALADEFARFTAIAGVAGGLGVVVGHVAVFTVAPISMNGFFGTVVFGLGYNALTEAVSIGLYALAGAAVAHFLTAD